MKWGRQPDKLQPSYASERTWIACRKWSWRATYFGGDTQTRVQLGWGEGYCSQVGAMAQCIRPSHRTWVSMTSGRAASEDAGSGQGSQLWRASAACHPGAFAS